MSLDYFLNDKALKSLSKTIENDTYYSTLPVNSKNKLAYKFNSQIEADHFLFNYVDAYGFLSSATENDIVSDFNIACALFNDSFFVDYDLFSLSKVIKSMKFGAKSNNQEEQLIQNFIQAMHLVEEKYFKIDENNFELFLHVIFKNIDVDLEYKANYYRSSIDKTENVSWNLQINEIDNELNKLFAQSEILKKSPPSGFSQLILLFVDFMCISPYKKHNYIVGCLLIHWFMNQTNEMKINKLMIPSLVLGVHWSEFIRLLNNDIQNEPCDITTTINFVMDAIKVDNSFNFKIKELLKVIKQPLTNNEIIIISLCMNISKNSFDFSDLNNALKIRNHSIILESEIEDIFTSLKTKGLISQIKNKYKLSEDSLIKIRIANQHYMKGN